MSAFPQSGQSDPEKLHEINGRFRPEAVVLPSMNPRVCVPPTCIDLETNGLVLSELPDNFAVKSSIEFHCLLLLQTSINFCGNVRASTGNKKRFADVPPGTSVSTAKISGSCSPNWRCPFWKYSSPVVVIFA